VFVFLQCGNIATATACIADETFRTVTKQILDEDKGLGKERKQREEQRAFHQMDEYETDA
jgi:hypothetical protein